MLLRMNDTQNGRQLVPAFTNHIRAWNDSTKLEDSNSNSEPGLFMELADG